MKWFQILVIPVSVAGLIWVSLSPKHTTADSVPTLPAAQIFIDHDKSIRITFNVDQNSIQDLAAIILSRDDPDAKTKIATLLKQAPAVTLILESKKGKP